MREGAAYSLIRYMKHLLLSDSHTAHRVDEAVPRLECPRKNRTHLLFWASAGGTMLPRAARNAFCV